MKRTLLAGLVWLLGVSSVTGCDDQASMAYGVNVAQDIYATCGISPRFHYYTEYYPSKTRRIRSYLEASVKEDQLPEGCADLINKYIHSKKAKVAELLFDCRITVTNNAYYEASMDCDATRLPEGKFKVVRDLFSN